VQQAAEERLRTVWRLCPVFWKRAAPRRRLNTTCRAVLGAEQIARGDLATSLGASASTTIRVQPLGDVPTPELIGETVEEVIDRAVGQPPDLQANVADIDLAAA